MLKCTFKKLIIERSCTQIFRSVWNLQRHVFTQHSISINSFRDDQNATQNVVSTFINFTNQDFFMQAFIALIAQHFETTNENIRSRKTSRCHDFFAIAFEKTSNAFAISFMISKIISNLEIRCSHSRIIQKAFVFDQTLSIDDDESFCDQSTSFCNKSNNSRFSLMYWIVKFRIVFFRVKMRKATIQFKFENVNDRLSNITKSIYFKRFHHYSLMTWKCRQKCRIKSKNWIDFLTQRNTFLMIFTNIDSRNKTSRQLILIHVCWFSKIEKILILWNCWNYLTLTIVQRRKHHAWNINMKIMLSFMRKR